MNNFVKIGMASIFLFIVLVSGIQLGKALEAKEPLKPMMAYGLVEKDQVWNRIRVDELGHVLCHKE